MTAVMAGPSGTNGFSMFSGEGYGLYRTRQEILWLSMLGQAAVVGLLVYLISCVAPGSPGVDGIRPLMKELPLVFSGHGGGGGGNFEKTPASQGALPRASLNEQLATDGNCAEGDAAGVFGGVEVVAEETLRRLRLRTGRFRERL